MPVEYQIFLFNFPLTSDYIIVYLRYRIIDIMAITKVSEFNTKERKIAALCKALAHPARIAIINFLIKKRECICSDVVNELPLSQSTVSQHLKELKEAGLIVGDIDGPRVCYCIDQKRWSEAGGIINKFLSQETIRDGKPC
jgi:DNA-binding transcriptional ArsR family regulator